MKTKLLGSLAIVLGIFLFAGVASASDADVLQPAGATTALESLRVGVAGQGGVTFFNGTVLNEGADPFTVGDDMRVDGEIYRVEKGGDNPLKISDNVIPTATNTNNFGTDDNRWKNVYSSYGHFSYDVSGWNFEVRDDSNVLIGSMSQLTNTDDLRISADKGKLRLDSEDGIVQIENDQVLRLAPASMPPCNSSREGSIYYRDVSDHFYGCNGTTWKQLDN